MTQPYWLASLAAAPAIQNMPVTSHICEPLKDAVVEGDEVTGACVGVGLAGVLGLGATQRCPILHSRGRCTAPCTMRCSPAPPPAVKGYAWSGGGQGIIRVDVSADGGTTWHTAQLHKVPQKRGARRWWAGRALRLPQPAVALRVLPAR